MLSCHPLHLGRRRERRFIAPHGFNLLNASLMVPEAAMLHAYARLTSIIERQEKTERASLVTSVSKKAGQALSYAIHANKYAQPSMVIGDSLHSVDRR